MVSDNQVDIDSYHDKEFIRQLKDCVYTKQDSVFTINEIFRKSYVFLRHSKAMKYSASYDIWQTLFNRSNIRLPDVVDKALFDRIVVSIVDVNEYTNCGPSGHFSITENRKEVVVTTKFALKEMKVGDFDSLTRILWCISQLFIKFIK
jgi:hypothetical protein